MPSPPAPHQSPTPAAAPQTVLLQTAIAAFVASQPPNSAHGPAHDSLYALDEFLGASDQLPAPLLEHFRAFLRDGGWFDAARPVNLFD